MEIVGSTLIDKPKSLQQRSSKKKNQGKELQHFLKNRLQRKQKFPRKESKEEGGT